MTHEVLSTLGVLLAAGLAARLLAGVLRLPEMLLMVAAGALLGPSALGVLEVPLASTGGQLLFTLGVSLILFYGGLNLSLHVLRRTATALALLAVPGVLITAAITGVAAHVAFGVPWDMAFLVGAVLAPTDPAILIPLFARSPLRAKVAQTVVAESALNDPTGAALAVALAGFVLADGGSILSPVADFAADLAVSALLGVAAGVALALMISSRRAGVLADSSVLAVLAVVVIGYFALDAVGGSGYLGAFLTGTIVGNMDHLGLGMHREHERDLRRFATHASDLVTLLVFVMLGANVPLGSIAGQPGARAGGRGGAAPRGAARNGADLHASRSPRPMDVAGDRLPGLDTRDRRRPRRAGRRPGRHGHSRRRRVRERRRARHRPNAAHAGAAGGVAGATARASRRPAHVECS